MKTARRCPHKATTSHDRTHLCPTNHGAAVAPPSLRDLLTDLLWWPVLTFSTVAPMLAAAYNFKHPDMTQMRVLLNAGEWYWLPFSLDVAIAWAWS